MSRITPMARRTASAAAAALALTLGGCSDSASNPVAPSTQLSPTRIAPERSSDNDVEHGHVMHGRPTQLEAFRNAAARSSGTGIFFHGGTVLLTTNVANIYWASAPIFVGGPTPGSTGSGAADGSLIGTFLRGLTGSPYFNINTTYTNAAGTHISNTVNYTQYYANNTNAPTGTANVTDAQMVAMLQAAFDGGKLTYDPNTLYSIFTAGAVNLGGGFGTQYCAYHTHATVTIGGVARTAYYAAMPYNGAYPAACTSGLAPANGSYDTGADFEVNTFVHEIEETTTDAMGNAWYDNRGYENGDKCAWTWGTTYTTAAGGKANVNLGGKDFLIQQNWKNSGTGGCALHL
ncbi:MAG: phosphate-responsive 1 family protein [Gemmatimonadetes bacterium]|nr:phosphate-responsive 1 family protein [Gemmatimonadota bacterium]